MTQELALEQSSLAFVLLVASLTIYHALFRRADFAWPRLTRLQERLRYPGLALAFLGPLTYLSYHLPDLSRWIDAEKAFSGYLIVVALCESILCLLLDAPSGPRIHNAFQSLIRLILYSTTALVPLSVALGLPLLDPEFQARVGSVVVLYLSLHLSYTYIFKWLPWRHPMALALRARLRFWIYIVMLIVVLEYTIIHLNLIEGNRTYLNYLEATLGVLVGTLLYEAFLVCLFDYYFHEVRRADVPTLFRDLARGLGFIAVFAISMVIFLHRDVSSLLLGSAVLSVAVGFALQETLGNFFAGLALRLARPYTLGDRVEVLALTGTVQKIDWRSTAILNYQGDLIIVPNSKLAQEAIVNHSSPVPTTGRFIEVGVHPRHPPNLVKAEILAACAAVPEALSEPVPEVYIINFDESAVTYRLRYFIRDFSDRFTLDSRVRESIWYRFNRKQIEIPYPTRNIYYRKPDSGVDLELEVLGMLEEVDFFRILQHAEVEQLARRSHYELYASGEKVCVQGEPGDSFYIIKSGRLRVSAVDATGEVFLSIELKAGQYFGEMALLTGEPRSATVSALTDTELIRLGKEDLRFILKANPEVETVISQVLAHRRLETDKARLEAAEERTARALSASDSSDGMEQLTEQFLKKIRNFFSY